MTRARMTVLVTAAVVAAGGLGAGVALAAAGPTGRPAATSTPASTPASGPAGTSSGVTGRNPYPWYRSMMGRYRGGMMMGGGPPRWMMGAGGYRWMTGGARAPGWMRGGRLPGFMMGSATDPGKIMGRLWAGAPGPRVSAGEAARLGSQVPAAARVNRGARTITFTSTAVRLVMLASPPGGPDETFRIAGLVNPTLVVPAGAHVSMEVINADHDTAHGAVVTAAGARPPWMPMMTAYPAFPGSALWFLGNPTAAGMHAGTLSFTARTAGTYHYLCPVPGHAQEGMTGTFVVAPAR